jgi:predicted RNA methylase
MPACDYSLVADIYDGYVRTDLDFAFFREESEKAKGRVLELMCGTGRLTLALLAEGVPMTCVDSSRDARPAAPEACPFGIRGRGL